MIEPHQILRFAIMLVTLAVAIFIVFQIWTWHKSPDHFDLRDLLTALGKDKRQHISRPAVFECVACFATTSGYLATLAALPATYVESTAIYGGLWAVRGGFSTYLRSKAK